VHDVFEELFDLEYDVFGTEALDAVDSNGFDRVPNDFEALFQNVGPEV